MKKVVVNIDKKGKATIEVSGIAGGGCALVTEAITRALSAKVVDDKKTPEFYATDTSVNTVHSGN